MRRILASVFLVLLLAGCVQTGPATSGESSGPVEPEPIVSVSGSGRGPNSGADWVERILGDHGGGEEGFATHRLWESHVGLSTPNFIELAHDPLAVPGFEGATAGGYYCGGQADTSDGRKITVISSFDTAVAFVVVDSTDPLRPIYLGDYFLDFAQTYDVDVTPDGKHVAIAANIPLGGQQAQGPPALDAAGLPLPVQVPLRAWFRDGCTGEVRPAGPLDTAARTVAAGPSTILVSLADPTSPQFEDIAPAPVLGPHSVSTAIIDGHTYIASSITNLAHQASYFEFFEVVTVPDPSGTYPDGFGRLVPLSVVDAAVFGATAVTNGHVDAEISKHPVTGKAVVYLSDWEGGLAILDFSIPQAPTLLSTWKDAGVQGGQIHSTRSIDGVHNGRHYLLVGQEFISHPENRPSGWVYILDDTDPAAVKEVGRWTLPIDVEAEWNGIELYSTHYFRVLGETVFIAMYHGGVWAFKLDYENPENMKLPPSVGAFVPDKGPHSGRTPDGTYDFGPFVLDVFPYPDGTLVIFDGLSGVYVVQYDEAKDMTPPEPWPAEGKTLG